jgi:hypothetical protein
MDGLIVSVWSRARRFQDKTATNFWRIDVERDVSFKDVTGKAHDPKAAPAHGSRVDRFAHPCCADSRVLAKLRSLLHSSCLLRRTDDRSAEEWDSDPDIAAHTWIHRNDFRGLSKTPPGEA